jgi:hypothetical protein
LAWPTESVLGPKRGEVVSWPPGLPTGAEPAAGGRGAGDGRCALGAACGLGPARLNNRMGAVQAAVYRRR